jgi:hypothetical protein
MAMLFIRRSPPRAFSTDKELKGGFRNIYLDGRWMSLDVQLLMSAINLNLSASEIFHLT